MKINKKIVLENGVVIEGIGFGDLTQRPVGELVFTTAMTGYEETLTDPSYTDQMIVFSYPLQGNYGINIYEEEGSKVNASAMIVNDLTDEYDHYLSNKSLNEYLIENKTLGIKGIDTRYLTKLLRNEGSLRAIIVDIEEDEKGIIDELKKIEFKDHISKVATKDPYHIPGLNKRVALIDFGYKRNIVKELVRRDLEVYVLPYSVTKEDIDNISPDGILLSNGPGDPKEYTSSIELVKSLIGSYPIFGICLGHQLYGLAKGAKTYKMKYGHRGINHSVRNTETKKVYMTSQNHGYCVDAKSIKDSDIEVLYEAVNDLSVEGLRNKKTNDFTVQYHPESHPGPNDTDFLFDEFVSLMGGNDEK